MLRGLFFAVYLVVLVGESGAGPVTKKVRVTGLAAILDDDLAAAFERAKRSALREAVEEAVGVLVSSATRVRNYELIADEVLTRSQGYVNEYEVVDRRPIGGHSYEVVIEARVDLGNLQDHLGALDLIVEQAGLPRVICRGSTIRATASGEREPAGWGVLEHEIGRALASVSDFLIVIQADDLATAPAGPGSSAAEAGPTARRAENYSVPIEITVEATAVVSEPAQVRVPFSNSSLAQAGLISSIAAVEVRMYWTQSGETIASLQATGRGVDIESRGAGRAAITDGVAQIADALRSALVEQLRQLAYGSRLIQLIVRASSRDQLHRFVSALRTNARIDKLFERTYDSGTGVFDARSDHDAFHLAGLLSHRGVDGVEVEIMRVSARSIELQIH